MTVAEYQLWYAQLVALAEQQGIAWIIGTGADAHMQAFEQGLSPDEELAVLADMAEWRGCGCGGGS